MLGRSVETGPVVRGPHFVRKLELMRRIWPGIGALSKLFQTGASDFGFRISGFEFRIQRYGFMVSGTNFQFSISGSSVLGFGFWRALDFEFRRVSGFGEFRVSGPVNMTRPRAHA